MRDALERLEKAAARKGLRAVQRSTPLDRAAARAVLERRGFGGDDRILEFLGWNNGFQIVGPSGREYLLGEIWWAASFDELVESDKVNLDVQSHTTLHSERDELSVDVNEFFPILSTDGGDLCIGRSSRYGEVLYQYSTLQALTPIFVSIEAALDSFRYVIEQELLDPATGEFVPGGFESFSSYCKKNNPSMLYWYEREWWIERGKRLSSR